MTNNNTVVLFLVMEINEAKEIVVMAVKEAVEYCGSQSALAEKAGVSQGAVNKYLRRDCMPTGVTARNLSRAVDNVIPKHRFAPLVFGD